MGDQSTNRRARQKAFRKGLWSEVLAAMALRLKGYRILDRRFKTKLGEIDLVARKGQLIIFVEVKARNNVQSALDGVGFWSKKRISDAADIWISRQPDAADLSWRFDIIAVIPRKWPVHLQDAF